MLVVGKDADPYKIMKDPDPGGLKTYGSGSGSTMFWHGWVSADPSIPSSYGTDLHLPVERQ